MNTHIPRAKTRTRLRHFLIHRHFALLWSGQTISELGSWITQQRPGLDSRPAPTSHPGTDSPASDTQLAPHAIAALYTLYTVRLLGISPLQYGFLVTMGGVGAFIGALAAPEIARRFGPGKTMIIAILLDGFLALLTPLCAWLPPLAFILLMVAQLVGDCGEMVYEINEISQLQSMAPANMLGRVHAARKVLVSVLTLIGTLLAGFLSELIGIQTTLWIGAIGITCSSLWILCSPVRKLRRDQFQE